ncbi:NADH-quinone oxidoreductase subunit NuoE [Dehalococcoidia bacterium]|nr:NADH-quinone oxidoreductase subunit NuoE [Dehalococcoidia bacterium]
MREQFRAVVEDFTRDRSKLIPILQKVQEAEGFLSPEAVADISHFLRLSENDIYSVASFYAQFRFTRPGDHIIKVCLGTACHVRGGERILESLERALNIQCGQTTEDFKFSLERVACIGCCALAPVAVIDEDVYSKMTPAKIKEVLALY